jgi:methylmalonyl-CoA mutase N-terminal domain/subunit
VEAGDTIIVGVNRFGDESQPLSVVAPDYSALEKLQVASVKTLREKRNAKAVEKALGALGDASKTGRRQLHLMPLIIDAVRARATVGEISATLAANWGLYMPAL